MKKADGEYWEKMIRKCMVKILVKGDVDPVKDGDDYRTDRISTIMTSAEDFIYKSPISFHKFVNIVVVSFFLSFLSSFSVS